MASLPVDSADSVHLQIEAMKLAFADALAYVADIDHMPVRPRPAAGRRLSQGAVEADRPVAGEGGVGGHGRRRAGTVYLTAADAGGMMVSMIQSNYMGFGSGVVVPGTGISLQNRGTGFSRDAGAPQPGRAAQSAHTTPSFRAS